MHTKWTVISANTNKTTAREGRRGWIRNVISSCKSNLRWLVANFNTQGKLSVIKSQIRFIAKTNVFTSYKIYNDLITKSC